MVILNVAGIAPGSTFQLPYAPAVEGPSGSPTSMELVFSTQTQWGGHWVSLPAQCEYGNDVGLRRF